MKNQTDTKAVLMDAFDRSEKKSVVDVCRIAGISPSSYWFHYYKDAPFRRLVLEKKMEILAAKLAAETTNGGKQ